MELDVSLDELISDEDLKEFTKNQLPFHSDIVKRRKELEEKQKRIMEFIQLVAGIFLAVTVFCRVQLEIRNPGMVHYTCPVRRDRGICSQIPYIQTAGPAILIAAPLHAPAQSGDNRQNRFLKGVEP